MLSRLRVLSVSRFFLLFIISCFPLLETLIPTYTRRGELHLSHDDQRGEMIVNWLETFLCTKDILDSYPHSLLDSTTLGMKIIVMA